jgi:competence protein ComEA
MSELSPDLRPLAPAGGRARLQDLVTRLRSGEDPVAGVALLLVVALVAGFFWYRAGLQGGEEAAVLPGAPVIAPTTTTAPALLVVHVAGAVVRPGLYRLPAGSRVSDAVEAAGGPAPLADLDRLNLAARLVDGQRVAVGRQGEPAPPGPAEEAGGTPPGQGPVDLNTAGQSELETLPGVGPARARAILEERARRGGFRSPQDLLRVPGIGERRFAELRDHVRV